MGAFQSDVSHCFVAQRIFGLLPRTTSDVRVGCLHVPLLPRLGRKEKESSTSFRLIHVLAFPPVNIINVHGSRLRFARPSPKMGFRQMRVKDDCNPKLRNFAALASLRRRRLVFSDVRMSVVRPARRHISRSRTEIHFCAPLVLPQFVNAKAFVRKSQKDLLLISLLLCLVADTPRTVTCFWRIYTLR